MWSAVRWPARSDATIVAVNPRRAAQTADGKPNVSRDRFDRADASGVLTRFSLLSQAAHFDEREPPRFQRVHAARHMRGNQVIEMKLQLIVKLVVHVGAVEQRPET